MQIIQYLPITRALAAALMPDVDCRRIYSLLARYGSLSAGIRWYVVSVISESTIVELNIFFLWRGVDKNG